MIAETLFDWQAARDAAMTQVEAHAGADFAERARAFVSAWLCGRGPVLGETISMAGEAAGIVPHDSRAWGPIYAALSRAGVIVRTGYAPRTRGHGSPGPVWKIAVDV